MNNSGPSRFPLVLLVISNTFLSLILIPPTYWLFTNPGSEAKGLSESNLFILYITIGYALAIGYVVSLWKNWYNPILWGASFLFNLPFLGIIGYLIFNAIKDEPKMMMGWFNPVVLIIVGWFSFVTITSAYYFKFSISAKGKERLP